MPTLPQGAPAEVGLPLLVKAAAGGGGRGMRVVRDAAGLEDALRAASREAEAAFGDGTVFCERFLERPRHVEVQALADAHGHVHALGLRDCSVQRRHQKIVEETPPPGLPPGLALRLERSAVAFCTAIGYRGAGTAEFLVDGDDLYFLELNGRIQVEHPVTEEALGIDLVALQIEAAAGAPLAEVPAATRNTRSRPGCTRRIPAPSFPRPGRSPACACPRRCASTPESRKATRSARRTTR